MKNSKRNSIHKNKLELITIRLIVFGALFSASAYSQHTENNDININKFAALKVGMMIPQGELTTIGNHPGIGLQYGFSFEKLLIGLEIDYRLLKSKNEFEFNYKDSVHITDRLGGNMYMGLGAAYQLANFKAGKVNMLFGCGADQLEPIKAEKYLDRFKGDGYIITYNINVGIEYCYPLNSNFELGLNAKFNVADYSIKNKTALTGNYISTGLVVKFLE